MTEREQELEREVAGLREQLEEAVELVNVERATAQLVRQRGVEGETVRTAVRTHLPIYYGSDGQPVSEAETVARAARDIGAAEARADSEHEARVAAEAALADAMSSLEALARAGTADQPYLDDMRNVRGYAANRAMVARTHLPAPQGGGEKGADMANETDDYRYHMTLPHAGEDGHPEGVKRAGRGRPDDAGGGA